MAASSSKRSREEITPSSRSTRSLTEEQQKAYNAVVSGQSVLITGPGGTGKTFLTRKIIQYFKSANRKIAVTATTGAAAVLVGGTTFHRWSCLGLWTQSVLELVKQVKMIKYVSVRWNSVDAILIDEVSMMDAELLSKFDKVARSVRNRHTVPFGGIQLVLLGDFFQLPPVSPKGERPPFVFLSPSWNSAGIQTFQLSVNHRQRNMEFQQMLARIREGIITAEDIELLKSREVPNIKELESVNGIQPTILMSHVSVAEKYNQEQLLKLEASKDRVEYKARISTSLVGKARDSALAYVLKNAPVPESIQLCPGAQVMLRVNLKKNYRLVNGSTGVVKETASDHVVVYFPSIKEEHAIKTHAWEFDGGEVVYHQLPLILAWAVTIHKSQGQQLEYMGVDMGNIFESGQAYTALSRITDLSGLYISNFNPALIRVSPEVVEFYRDLKK